MKLLVALIVLGAVLAPRGAGAQERGADAPEYFRETVRSAVRSTDISSDLRTYRGADRRIDAREGVTRAIYRSPRLAARRSSPEAAARAVLARASRELGLDGSGELRVVSLRSTDVSHHVLFQQFVSGVPVYRRVVKVNLDADLDPTIILNGVATGISGSAPDVTPVVSSAEARRVARGTVTGGKASVTEADLQVLPSSPPRLVWRMVLWPDEAAGEWEVLVDARTAEVVQLLDQATHRAGFENLAGYRRPTAEMVSAGTAATGTGYVFDPDPLTSSGAAYGPPYVDATDNDISELNAERVLVDLLGITLGNDGNYRLDGPYVRIVGGGSLSPAYEPPAVADPDGFRFLRGEDHFEAVNAYFHIDKSQRYVQSLGFLDRQNGPLKVNPRAFAADNSFYTPSQNIIEYGIGGVDDAEDAGVLWHEYGHALLEAGAAGLNAASEGQALHEGWSDYWAGSYLRFLAETQAGKRDDWENVFRWDSGDGQIWAGRSLTRQGTYPGDTTCDDAGDSEGDGCNIYSDGLLWATALMELYTDLGKPVIDRLVIHSHSYLAHPVTFADAAEALVQADRDLFGGTHTAVIYDRLEARGYLSGAIGPVVSHMRLPATEDLGGTVRVEVEAVAGNSPVRTVTMNHRVAGASFSEQTLDLESGSTYATEFALPTEPSTVEYYIVAVDENSTLARLPSSADSYFSFDVGPDSEPPSISHIPISFASSALWPAEVVAGVEDNLGVDSVWVDFSIEDGIGAVYDSGRFGLAFNGSDYRGAFTTAASMLQPSSTVRYSLTARDAAVAGNTAVDPAGDPHHFPVVFSGLLQQWDLEVTDGNFVPTGDWSYGTPGFTLRATHSGDRLWGTGLGEPYSDVEGVSSLDLPPVNLDGLDSAYLIFWHWYDLEYRGVAEPGRLVQGSFWDGANVKVAVGAANFEVAVPVGGYPGSIDAAGANPLGGQPAFGAYSFGWRRVVIPLPTLRDVRVRFEMGTDSGNFEQSIAYAGWFIDDVSISTDLPEDAASPVVLASPAALRVQPVGQPLPAFSLTAEDDTGVESVYVDYSYGGSAGSTGSFPLAMSLTDLLRFEGLIPSEPSLAAGERLEYRFRLADFDGNETIFPGLQEPPLAVEYRTVAAVDVLVDVTPTGEWGREGSVWSLVAGDESAPAVSSLVLPPSSLPSNAVDIWLALQHSYQLGDNLGGNVSFSADDGRSWAVLSPLDGYPARFAVPEHPMNGQDVFSGESDGLVTTLFDLSEYAGREVRFRIDFGAGRDLEAGERWAVTSATVQASSVEEQIEIPVELSLNANFPDPFASTTTISYTVPEQAVARMDVYNVLGQLVALLTNRVHQPGTHTLTFDGSDLPSGVYFLTLDVGGARKVEKMVIAR